MFHTNPELDENVPDLPRSRHTVFPCVCPALKVLSFLVNGVTTPDATTLANVATALCRCTYEARNHVRLVTEFNTAQALCYIMQRQSVNLKVRSLPRRLLLLTLSAEGIVGRGLISFIMQSCLCGGGELAGYPSELYGRVHMAGHLAFAP